MRIVALLFCLTLIGCTTAPKKHVLPPQPVKEKTVLPPSPQPQQIMPVQKIQTVAETQPAAPAEKFCMDSKELDNIIAIFSEAIITDPHFAGSYYNRATAYFYKKDYEKSWQDIHKAEALGITADQKFTNLVEKLKKASGREQ